MKLLVALLLLSGCGDDATTMPTDAGPIDAGPVDSGRVSTCRPAEPEDAGPLPPFCDPPTPPPEALLRANGTAPFLLPGGRVLDPAGPTTILGGFPIDLRAHPTLPLVYVANTGYAYRAVQVFDVATNEIVQAIERADAFYGIALTPDASELWASGGDSGLVEIYDIGVDGQLAPAGSVIVGGYPSGIAISADGTRVWVAQLQDDAIVEIDPGSRVVTQTIPLEVAAPYAVVEIASRRELWISGFGDTRIAVVDLATDTSVATIDVGAGNPLGLAVSADGARLYATVTDGDEVIAIDTATRGITDRTPMGEASLVGDDGQPLPASSPSGLALDEPNDRLYVARAADNAVAVLEASTLDPIGAIPVGWYPTAIAVRGAAGSALAVTNAKGVGVGPLPDYGMGDESGKERMAGTITTVDLATLDLPGATADVEAFVRRPDTVYPFTCDGTFPVPAEPGGPTPIRHVVLIVRENKTYDTVFGDLAAGDRDASLVMYGRDVTPNIHALAERYAHHDNFYNDGETSVQGHAWLTASFVNDYLERTWLEDYRGASGFGTDAVIVNRAVPEQTFFTHLLRHGVDFRIYGEVVGAEGEHEDQQVADHIDTRFPGVFYNLDVPDEDKANYVADQILECGRLASFTYLLLPNDHTHGLSRGALAPESMIADNDRGTGIVVDAITRSAFWPSTAIFILQDDTQVGADHVDYHRSILVVVSPWAKRGYVSSVHTSFPSVFRTIEHILGVPPMNRYDALATPLYDAFTTAPELETFTALPRIVPDRRNERVREDLARASEAMDFSGPDRNPRLGELLAAHHLGTPFHSPEDIDGDARADLDERIDEDARERDMHDRGRDFLLDHIRRRALDADLR